MLNGNTDGRESTAKEDAMLGQLKARYITTKEDRGLSVVPDTAAGVVETVSLRVGSGGPSKDKERTNNPPRIRDRILKIL